ncbi:MAG: hypothetical protein ACE5GZ_08445 [Gammaproteobacteria bacterium]
MIEQASEQEFLEGIKQDLDRSVRDIDGSTLSRLTRMRKQALDNMAGRGLNRPYWLPVGAFTMACLVFAIVAYLPEQQTEQADMVDDIELISSSEDLEFFEDLEFYEWLEDHELPT